MTSKLEIINEAKRSYERCLNDIHKMTKVVNQDILVDKDSLIDKINDMKKELVNRMESLNFQKKN